MNQPDLIPPPTHVAMEVPGAALAQTVERLRDLGVVILAYDVKLSTYTLSMIVPYGVDISRVMEGQQQ
jgi:hypothetical protein